MPDEIQVFNFEQHEVRVVVKNGEPWWVAKDICDVLELQNPREIINRVLGAEEKSKAKISTSCGERDVNIISESGLYMLIMRSIKPEARRLSKWVASVVLPSIGEVFGRKKTMSNEIQVFNFEQREVRIVMKDGEPWWVAKDVCDVLRIQNVTQAVQRLDEDEHSMFDIGCNGGPERNIINESGLYALILRSDKPEAKRFRKWVTSVVLPSIRKTGGYSIPQKDNKDERLKQSAERLEIQKQNANTRAAKALQKMIESPKYPITDESKQILIHEATRIITGKSFPQMLPDHTEVLFSATQVGLALGISNRKVHQIAKDIGIRAPEGERNEFGLWKMTKSPHSPHECAQWMITSAGKQKIAEAYKEAYL